jgi:hypothetical protein
MRMCNRPTRLPSFQGKDLPFGDGHTDQGGSLSNRATMRNRSVQSRGSGQCPDQVASPTTMPLYRWPDEEILQGSGQSARIITDASATQFA